MRKKPSYDWTWFTSKAPFKKIFENICDLKIIIETHEIPIFGFDSIKQKKKHYIIKKKHYIIKLNYNIFELRFKEIKEKLLNTKVSKNNVKVYSLVNEMQCNKKDLCNLIINGCIPNATGTFKWILE